jgi:hypothetical protein
MDLVSPRMKECYIDRFREYVWRSNGEDGQSRREQVPSRYSNSEARKREAIDIKRRKDCCT